MTLINEGYKIQLPEYDADGYWESILAIIKSNPKIRIRMDFTCEANRDNALRGLKYAGARSTSDAGLKIKKEDCVVWLWMGAKSAAQNFDDLWLYTDDLARFLRLDPRSNGLAKGWKEV